MNKPLSILMVADFFYPDTVGGSGIVVYELSKRLVERGYNVIVLTRCVNNLPMQEIIDGIKVFRYKIPPGNNVWFYYYSLINSARCFREIIAETSIDLIHFHHSYTSFAINLCKKSKEINKIFSFHGPWDKESASIDNVRASSNLSIYSYLKSSVLRIKYLLMRKIEQYNLKISKKIIVLSQYMSSEA